MVYKVQIDDQIRDATVQETAYFDALKTEADAKAKAETDRAKLKEDTLKKLGITADEIAALFS